MFLNIPGAQCYVEIFFLHSEGEEEKNPKNKTLKRKLAGRVARFVRKSKETLPCSQSGTNGEETSATIFIRERKGVFLK